MDLKDIQICKALVPKNYLENALNAQCVHKKAIKELLEKRKLNESPWPEERIQMLISQLAQLDSNNFMHATRVGEREARIICPLVARRNFNMGHGIGRSGDLLESQPKAAGSTIIQNLTNALVLDLVKSIGLSRCDSLLVIPMATGMTLTLCMLTFKKQRPKARYVLWSRIDQKSCFKSITTAGLTPVIIEPIWHEESNILSTNLEEFERKILELKSEQILCLYTTTSCFAPREPDDVMSIAKLARKYNLPHLINHAYGLQTLHLNKLVDDAASKGRVDYVVQSTDKNLMVPVGGAIVIGYEASAITQLSKTYAGRASSAQAVDVLMTLLYVGKTEYKNLMTQRDTHFKEMRDEIQSTMCKNIEGLKMIHNVRNCISIAIDLSQEKAGILEGSHTALGSMLFTRGVSGARVVVSGDEKVIDGHVFSSWGSHNSDFKGAYMTVAATVGMSTEDITNFGKLFLKVYNEIARDKRQTQ